MSPGKNKEKRVKNKKCNCISGVNYFETTLVTICGLKLKHWLQLPDTRVSRAAECLIVSNNYIRVFLGFTATNFVP